MIDILNIEYTNGYKNAIDECLEILKFYKDNFDDIEWAIRHISELKGRIE